MTPGEDVVLSVRRWPWIVAASASLFLMGLVLWLALMGRPLPRSIIPAPVVGAIALIAGPAVLSISWSFLTAEFALRLSAKGVEGWNQPAGFRGWYRGERFGLDWSEIRNVDVVTRWATRQARITPDVGPPVLVNPIHVSGFSASDADVVVALMTERLASHG